MHCGLCLPTCPTYDATKQEKSSPRGRIALMRAIADETLEPTAGFSWEMDFCLGCLACETACPAGVDYTLLFEMGRAEAARSVKNRSWLRRLVRRFLLGWLFGEQSRLQLAARLVWFYQASGVQKLLRGLGIFYLLPKRWRELEAQTPPVRPPFSEVRIAEREMPAGATGAESKVAILTGCVQDVCFADVNRDTADALLAVGCVVQTPRGQGCCGSLHAHTGEWETAKARARELLDCFPESMLIGLDAVITNAAGCGSHLKHYNRLLADDPEYATRAQLFASKVRDVTEYLAVRLKTHSMRATSESPAIPLTYHDACHLCHGQKITQQPRELLAALPGYAYCELPEATWCCGSAGVYNLTQPEMSEQLLERKLEKIAQTGAKVVATANPGCLLQLRRGAKARGMDVEFVHPVTLLARSEK